MTTSTPSNEVTERALYDAVAKLIKAKGRFHTEQNYAALVKAFDACTPTAAIPRTSAEAVDAQGLDYWRKKAIALAEKLTALERKDGTNEKAAFEAAYVEELFRHDYNKYGAYEAAWTVWQLARSTPTREVVRHLGGRLQPHPAPADSAPMQPAESAILTRQVSEWRKEVARLQDLIGTAIGLADSAAEDCTLCDGMGMLDGIGSTCPHCNGSGKESDSVAERDAAWISVEDRLPEDAAFVAIFDPDNKDMPVRTAQWLAGSATFESELGWLAKDEVSHWQPLPAPPAALHTNTGEK